MKHSHRYTYPIQELTTKSGCVKTASRELLSLFNSAWLCTTLPTCSPWALHQYVSEHHRIRDAAMPNSILREKKVKTVGECLGLFRGVNGAVPAKPTAPNFQELASAKCFAVT